MKLTNNSHLKKLTKVGASSLSILLPKKMLESIGIDIDDIVNVKKHGNKIIITKWEK